MAKDLVSSLGNAELNALMAVQLKKLNEANAKLNRLFQDNNCTDFNGAFQATLSADFISKRNQVLDELASILDVMDRLRVAQNNLAKGGRKESHES
ncbi:MAG: hypothetical protein IJZ68_07200 [Bacteroidaceae bacterium]|nr:hypothetical protein [Bacteroidaceae bacterium]